eukprot:scaffold62937_cov21-Prasinocladus_malaysianus.AAC.2
MELVELSKNDMGAILATKTAAVTVKAVFQKANGGLRSSGRVPWDTARSPLDALLCRQPSSTGSSRSKHQPGDMAWGAIS